MWKQCRFLVAAGMLPIIFINNPYSMKMSLCWWRIAQTIDIKCQIDGSTSSIGIVPMASEKWSLIMPPRAWKWRELRGSAARRSPGDHYAVETSDIGFDKSLL